MDSSLNHVSENLSDLTSVELQKVIELAKTLQANKSASTEPPEVNILYDTLSEEVEFHSSFEQPPLSIFKGRDRKSYLKLLEAVSLIDTWTRSAGAEATTRLKKRNLYATLVMLVSSYLDDLEVPITSKTVLNSFHKFPSLVDKAFPGYVQSGLIHMVFTRSRNNRAA